MDGHCFWGRWALAHWLVRSCSHSLWESPLRVRFMDYFPSRKKGEERAQIPAEF